jgi:hypothetical protein
MAGSVIDIAANTDPSGAALTEVRGFDVTARYVKWMASSPNNMRYTGAAELQFYTVPEPATMSLLGLGGLVAIRRRR